MTPGSREGFCAWTDKNGDVWIFGGSRLPSDGSYVYSDIWKIDVEESNVTFMWVGGSTEVNDPGVPALEGKRYN